MRGFIQSKLVTVSTRKLTIIAIVISVIITIILTGIMSILIVQRLSIELILANTVIAIIVAAIVAPFAASLLKQAINWEQVSHDLEYENLERKRFEAEATQKASDMRAISELAIECAAATADTDSLGLITEKLRDITNALGVGITLYDPETRTLTTKHIAVSGQVLEVANRLVGYNLIGMVNHVTPEMERRMLEGKIESFEDLSEVSFGAVPKPIATIIKNTLGVGRFTGMALAHGGSLIGTAIIAQHERQPELNMDVCTTLAHFSAVAILRMKAEVELRESMTKFKTLIENLSEGILLLDEQGLIIEWNPVKEQLTGLTREQVLGKPIWDVQTQLMPENARKPEYHENLKQLIQNALRSGDFPNFNRPTQGVIQSADGYTRDILQTSFPIRTDSGLRIGSIMRDISSQKKAEALRESLIAELKSKNAELEQFTYTVSHDLKAPLITIKGFLGLLEKDASEGNQERIKKDMARIIEAADKMQQLLNELLELSRIGRIVNPSQEVAFEKILQIAVESVHGRLDASGVKIEVKGNLPIVFVDQTRAAQVIQNLLENAAKFMGEQIQPTITIGAQGKDTDGKPIFFIKDNGIGIDPYQLDNVFGLFQKLDIHAEGTGVGLALVKRIIEVHGGRIWITSDGIGKGTTVWFTLPAP